jgi:hypothetical protein
MEMNSNVAINNLFLDVLAKYKTPTGHYKTKRTVTVEHEDSGEYGSYVIELDEEINNVINEHDNVVLDGEILAGGCSAYEITPDKRYISLSIGIAVLRQTDVEPDLSFYDTYRGGVYYQMHEFLPLSPFEIEKLT